MPQQPSLSPSFSLRVFPRLSPFLAPLLSPVIAALATACLLLAVGSSTAHAELPAELARSANAAGIPESAITVWIAPAQGGTASLQHNAIQPFNPASLIKLLTTQAGLEMLGPNWRWQTTARLGAPLQDGVLRGPLHVIASGDPTLTWDRLGAWLRDWRARGLRDIRGDIVIDAGRFTAPPRPSTLADDDGAQRAYNAQPSALLANFNALSVRLAPAANGIDAVSLVPSANLRIVNRLRAVPGPCPDWRGRMDTPLTADSRGLQLVLDGQMPASCGERILNLAVPEGLQWPEGIVRQLWQEMGGNWQGRLREGPAPLDAAVFSAWDSPPLAEAVRDINKFSNNVMARALYLSLGGGNTTDAGTTLRTWLKAQGMDFPELVLENGAGLSRQERISAAHLGALLQHAFGSPRMPELMASLPVAGLDGTARRRFDGRPDSGRAYLKSGSLRDVAGLAGYVLDDSGRWQALVVIINQPNVGNVDALLQLAVRTAAARRP
ncbi:D-alanyl-D-alanine carboxypeptidase/D-alanyl-D-alanine endopeptidase [Uliginosibacterium sp. H1]|uniref:D-alanyl-D-alanine carboxypeptidase/D-alanyl-D-alanine endopeptidase n=1 Tax=Uliginosibacterium sp. H1 TaxID=3114757 RepID=UPI002E18B59B|nr:D-alanyl-D-alanine carboxypeptidase/D-alanyl-D-alanine-endopeptidase [Uliginosibacterium sp. H1]